MIYSNIAGRKGHKGFTLNGMHFTFNESKQAYFYDKSEKLFFVLETAEYYKEQGTEIIWD